MRGLQRGRDSYEMRDGGHENGGHGTFPPLLSYAEIQCRMLVTARAAVTSELLFTAVVDSPVDSSAAVVVVVVIVVVVVDDVVPDASLLATHLVGFHFGVPRLRACCRP